MHYFIPGDFYTGIPLLSLRINPMFSQSLPALHAWGPDNSGIPGAQGYVAFGLRHGSVTLISDRGEVIARLGASDAPRWQP